MRRKIYLISLFILALFSLSVSCKGPKRVNKKKAVSKSTLTDREKKLYLLKDVPDSIQYPVKGRFKGSKGEIEILGADVEPRRDAVLARLLTVGETVGAVKERLAVARQEHDAREHPVAIHADQDLIERLGQLEVAPPLGKVELQ